MARMLAKRAVLFIAALWVISIAIFFMLRVLPGDVAAIMAGINAPASRVRQLREQLGLNMPLWQQYWRWLIDLLHGNFGISIITGRTVSELVAMRAAITFPLISMSLIVALSIGIPLGSYQVMHRGRLSAVLRLIALIGGCVPALWGGMLLILLFGQGVGLLPILPAQGFPTEGWTAMPQAFLSLILPSLTVGMIVGSAIMRYTAAAVGEVMRSEMAVMALACGMSPRSVLRHVGLRLSIPQLISIIGLTFAHMITGVMVIENLCSLPGLGMGLIRDLGTRDLIVVQSELIMLSAVFLCIGFIVDVIHRLVDSRLGDA